MVLRTTNLGIPYVEGTDTVTSYPTVSQEIATDLETLINGANIACGLGVSAGNAALASLGITIQAQQPSGAFTYAAPNLTCVYSGLYVVSAEVTIAGAVTTGRTFLQIKSNGAPAVLRTEAPIGVDQFTAAGLMKVNAGGTLAVDVFQTTGNSRTVSGTFRVARLVNSATA